MKDYDAYFRSVRDRFLEHVANSAGRPLAKAVDPVVPCDLCDWRKRCAEERTEVDHLSLVAGIHRRQMDSLRATDVATLGTLDLAAHPKIMGTARVPAAISAPHAM